MLLLITASVLTFALSIATGESSLLVLPFVAIFGCAWGLWRDLYVLEQRIEGVLLASRGDRTVPPYRPLTELGRSVFRGLEALVFRVQAQDWEMEVDAAAEKGVVTRATLTSDIDIAQLSKGVDSRTFFAKVLEVIPSQFRCRAAAIVLPDGSMLMWGQSGERFQRHLSALLRDRTERGALYGLSDASDSKSLVGDLSPFGIRYSIVHPCEGEQAAMLWLGYSGDEPPAEMEVRRAAELAKSMRAEIVACEAFVQLSEQVREIEAESKQKSEFIAHVSHDIRSPLNNIRSILKLLEVEGGAGDALRLLQVALGNCDSLGEIVEDVLDFSKHQAGKLVAKREWIPISPLVESVVESFQIAARGKGLALHFAGPPESEIEVCVDRRQLRRVLFNVIGNALKYTMHGSVNVILSFRDDRLTLRVEDTGIGMTVEEVKQLFTPFTRFHIPGTEGIGLGLALSRILVELSGGAIHVRSEKGVGSRFELQFDARPAESVLAGPVLPLSAGTPSAAPAPLATLLPFERSSAPLPSVNRTGLSVLVVDDDHDCAETLARTLRLSGCEVMTAYTVGDAISLLNFGAPDVIVSDHGIPDGGAERLLQAVKARPEEIPVIIVTGDPEDRYPELVGRGAHRVLTKPVEAGDLVSLMNELYPTQREGVAAARTSIAQCG